MTWIYYSFYEWKDAIFFESFVDCDDIYEIYFIKCLLFSFHSKYNYFLNFGWIDANTQSLHLQSYIMLYMKNTYNHIWFYSAFFKSSSPQPLTSEFIYLGFYSVKVYKEVYKHIYTHKYGMILSYILISYDVFKRKYKYV